MSEYRTYRVMDLHGNTLNWVVHASKEHDSDAVDRANAKRLRDASWKMTLWSDIRGEKLTIVECDDQGYPIDERGHRRRSSR